MLILMRDVTGREERYLRVLKFLQVEQAIVIAVTKPVDKLLLTPITKGVQMDSDLDLQKFSQIHFGNSYRILNTSALKHIITHI